MSNEVEINQQDRGIIPNANTVGVQFNELGDFSKLGIKYYYQYYHQKEHRFHGTDPKKIQVNGIPSEFWGRTTPKDIQQLIEQLQNSKNLHCMGLFTYKSPDKVDYIGFMVGIPLSSISPNVAVFLPSMPDLDKFNAPINLAIKHQLPIVHHHEHLAPNTSHVFAIGFEDEDKETLRTNLPEYMELEHFEHDEMDKLQSRIQELIGEAEDGNGNSA